MTQANCKPETQTDLTQTALLKDTVVAPRRFASKAELLQTVTSLRDDYGRMQDTASHLLFLEIAVALGWDEGTAREDLLRRVKAFRDTAGAADGYLAMVLSEVLSALGAEPDRKSVV